MLDSFASVPSGLCSSSEDARVLAYRTWRSSDRGRSAVDNKISGSAFKQELNSWELRETPCPWQSDGTSCGVHVFLNAVHIISGREIPLRYTDEQVKAARHRMQLFVLRSAQSAFSGI